MAKKPTKDEKRQRRAAETFDALLLAANRGQGRGVTELVDAWRGLEPLARNRHLPAVQELVATTLASALSGKVDGGALERWIGIGVRAPETFGGGGGGGGGDEALERWWALLRMCLLRRSTTLGRRAWQHLAAPTAAKSARVYALIDGLLAAPDGARDVATLSHLSYLARHLPALVDTARADHKGGGQHERPADVTPALIARLFSGVFTGPAPAIAEVRAWVRRASSSQARDVWEAVAPFALRQAIRDDDDVALSLFIESLEKSAKSAQLERDLGICLAWLATKLHEKTPSALDFLVRIGSRANTWGVPFDEALMSFAFELAASSPEGCIAIGPLLTQTLLGQAAAHVVGSEASLPLVRALLRTCHAIELAHADGFDVDAVHRAIHRILDDVLRGFAALGVVFRELGPSVGPVAMRYLLAVIPVHSVPLATKRFVEAGTPTVLFALVEDLQGHLERLDIKAKWPQLTDALIRDFWDICDGVTSLPGRALNERHVFELLNTCMPLERPLMVRPVMDVLNGKQIPVSEVTRVLWQEIGAPLLALTPRAIHVAQHVHGDAPALLEDCVRGLQHFDVPEEALEFLMTVDRELTPEVFDMAHVRVDALERRFAGLPRLWHRLFTSHLPCDCGTQILLAAHVLADDHTSGAVSAEGREVRQVFWGLGREFDRLMSPPAKPRRKTRVPAAEARAGSGPKAKLEAPVSRSRKEPSGTGDGATPTPRPKTARASAPPQPELPLWPPMPAAATPDTPTESPTPRARRKPSAPKGDAPLTTPMEAPAPAPAPRTRKPRTKTKAIAEEPVAVPAVPAVSASIEGPGSSGVKPKPKPKPKPGPK